jgi:hypothetical protein
MMDRFVAAVLDTLVPGGALANGVVAPPASAIGIDEDELRRRHGAVLTAVAESAGGDEAFCSGTDDFRVEAMRRAEKAQPREFPAHVTNVLTLYYEHPKVLAAFGWPQRPPQPLGHELPPFDEALLEPVKARGEIWRKPG